MGKKTKNIMKTFCLDPDTWRRARAYCDYEGINMSKVVNRLLTTWINKKIKENKSLVDGSEIIINYEK